MTQAYPYEITEDGIVSTLTGEIIPADEPVVIFRAQDRHLPDTLTEYMRRCSSHSKRISMATKYKAVLGWQHQNEDKVKEPD